jgi:uncharacterized oxidoreductase
LDEKNMILRDQTVLITGGSSGIGLELAKQLLAKNNVVVICGRSMERLMEAKKMLGDVHTFQCDIARGDERVKLVEWMAREHPSCNVLINNAAIVHRTDFASDADILLKARNEIETNLFAPIALTKMMLASFQKQQQSLVVNVTTGLVYAPRSVYPIYNATKAGLHAFTQVLREQMRGGSVQFVEAIMPVVDTPWHKGKVPSMAISPATAVNEMLAKIHDGEVELRIGRVGLLYLLSRIAPGFAFRKINSID